MSNKETNPASCQTTVSSSAFSIHDLKCGNILNYDTAEGGILPTVIDWQDLKWLTEDPKGFNLVHSPIPLTEEWLLKFGFKPGNLQVYNKWIDEYEMISFFIDYELNYYGICVKGKDVWTSAKKINLHKLQNLYHSLTGVMLSLG